MFKIYGLFIEYNVFLLDESKETIYIIYFEPKSKSIQNLFINSK